jgi:Glycosyltransferase 61
MGFKIPYEHEVKQVLKQGLRLTSSWVGRRALTRAESISLLQENAVYQHRHESRFLPGLQAFDQVSVPFLEEERWIDYDPDYVWKIQNSKAINSLKIGKNGGVFVNGNLLNLDFNSTADLLVNPFQKSPIAHPAIVVAPWSHPWAGYYDFVVFILAKLCRIEAALGTEIWQQANVCYPLQNLPFEWEFLQKLGIPKSSLVDTRSLEIQADCVIVANNQPSWFYASPVDLMLLRQKFCAPEPSPPTQRVYLSRAGRRQVENEAEVRKALQKLGFQIIEDIPRTVDEQISLFQSAAIVVAPHGAGLTNLLWCQPGTRVIELFHSNYTPLYYSYICHILGFDYTYLASPETEDKWIAHADKMSHNIIVDVDSLQKILTS